MKKLLLPLALLAGCLHANTQLVSDFSPDYAPTWFTEPLPMSPANGPWANSASSDATTFTIAGTASGLSGNAFFEFLFAGPQDWSGFSHVVLTGLTPGTNATPFLYFYVEDAFANSSLTAFALNDFAGGSTIGQLLNGGGVDLTQVAIWGFSTYEDNPTAFGFTFDRLELSTEAPPVPETTSAILLLGFSLLGLAGLRRRLHRA
jgi:hypothetical protein